MVTRLMPPTTPLAATRARVQREYILRGSVVDRGTKRGVQGLRVEAWDRDTRYHDMLGQVITDLNGEFTVAFDGVYFGDFAPDRAPDVFFRVFLDDAEILSTFEQAQYNLQKGSTQVRLEIDLPSVQPQGRDYVSAEQMFKAMDWWQASDFRGVWRQGVDKTRTVGTLARTLTGDAIKNFNLKPLRPQSTPEREIVGQNLGSARNALALQQVEVSNVKSVTELRDTRNLKTLSAYPLRLKANDRITLYESDGVVKYYTLDTPPASVDLQTLQRIDEDVQEVKARSVEVDALRTDLAQIKSNSSEITAARSEDAALLKMQSESLQKLQLELEEVRQANARKDATITQLQADLVRVTTAQDRLATQVGAERIRALELAVQQLNPNLIPSAAVVSRTSAVAKVAATKAVAKATQKTPAKTISKTVSKTVSKTASKTIPKTTTPRKGGTR